MSADKRSETMSLLLGWLGIGAVDTPHPRLYEPWIRIREPRAGASSRIREDDPLSGDIKAFYEITDGLMFPAGGDFPSLLRVGEGWPVDEEWGGFKQQRATALRVIGGDYNDGFILVDLSSATQRVWLVKPEEQQWVRLGAFRDFVKWLVLQSLECGGVGFPELIESGRFETFSDFQDG